MSEENLDLVNAPAAENQADVSGTNETSQPEQATETAEQQPAAETEAPKEDKGLPKGVERRFAKMSKRHHEDQARLAEMEAKLAKLTAEPEKMREEYTEDEWMDKVVNDRVSAALEAKANEQKTQAEQREAAAQKSEAWNKRIDSFREEMPDYTETLAEAHIDLPVDVFDQITNSDVGPRLAYHLAKNPDQADAIAGMGEIQRGLAIAKLEMAMQGAPKQAEPVTRAAPTPKSGGGAGSTYNPLGDEASMDDFIKARRQKLYGN